MFRRLMVSGLAFGFSLLLAEVALSVLGLPRGLDEFSFLGGELAQAGTFAADERLFWRLDSGGDRYRANAAGFRGDWPGRGQTGRGGRGAAEYRIVCIGDSCTFGAGVLYEEAYGLQLEELLQDRWPDRAVRSFLLGLPGYTTHQNRLAFEDHGAALAPDLTVLYVGAWNDFGPAVGLDDAERSNAQSGWRLARLVSVASRDERAATVERLRASYLGGEAPSVRRVAPAAFTANVRAIVARARALGSEVVLVLPAWPEKTRRAHPVTGRDRESLIDLAAELTLRTIDAQAVFARFVAGLPTELRSNAERVESLLFLDWVHPTALGYGLIAQAIADDVGSDRIDPSHSGRAPGAEPRPPAAVTFVEPIARVLARRKLRVADDPLRVRVGPLVALPAGAAGELEIRGVLPPGPQTVRWTGAQGGVDTAQIDVPAPRLEIDVRRIADSPRVRLTVTVDGVPECAAGMFLSTGQADGEPTRCGSFDLVSLDPGRPAGRPDLPFEFPATGLPGAVGKSDATGRCVLTYELDLPPDAAREATLWVQAVVFGPSELTCALTAARRVDLSQVR